MISMDLFGKGSNSRQSATESDEDFTWTSKAQSPEDDKFDTIIGELEDLLVDDDFVTLQTSFFEKHHTQFSEDEENKLIYTEIFNAYTQAIESFISTKMASRLSWFSMPAFLALLKSKSDSLDGEVFEMLETIGDFGAFKELILEYKRDKEGRGIDLSGLLEVKHSSG